MPVGSVSSSHGQADLRSVLRANVGITATLLTDPGGEMNGPSGRELVGGPPAARLSGSTSAISDGRGRRQLGPQLDGYLPDTGSFRGAAANRFSLLPVSTYKRRSRLSKAVSRCQPSATRTRGSTLQPKTSGKLRYSDTSYHSPSGSGSDLLPTRRLS